MMTSTTLSITADVTRERLLLFAVATLAVLLEAAAARARGLAMGMLR
jgi:hypothetical protein